MILGAIVIIVVGLLLVNYFRGLDSGVTLPTGQQAEQEGPTITRNGQIFHIVQSGETLWSISERYYDSGYNWTDIAKANNLANPSLIENNQELAIPEVEPKQPTTEVASSGALEDNNGTPEAISGATYTVVRGDSLWTIAVRSYSDGYRWVDIARENNLLNPDVIHSGNELRLPR